MSAARQDLKCTPRAPAHTELERRLARACDELQRARCRLHQNHEAVLAAEDALMACRLTWEEAALRVAALADIVESLQRDLDGLDGLDSLDGLGARVDAGISENLG